MNSFLMLSLASCLVSYFVVVNGFFESKTQKEYPKYHVGLVLVEDLDRSIDPFCAGVVVADKWIATHQSCLGDGPNTYDTSEIVSEIVAVAGVTSLKNVKKGNIIHFEDVKTNGEIALVKTKESLLSAGATVVSLPSTSSCFCSGVISEFVQLYGHERGAGTLKQVAAVVFSNKKCPKIKESTEFCVGNIEDWLNYVCPLSGGPFVVDNVLYGIRLTTCGDTGRYSDVLKSVQWIKENIA